MEKDKKNNLQNSINIALGVLIIVLFAQLMALKTEVRVLNAQHLTEEHSKESLSLLRISPHIVTLKE